MDLSKRVARMRFYNMRSTKKRGKQVRKSGPRTTRLKLTREFDRLRNLMSSVTADIRESRQSARP
ncbi:hypothetical protein WG922_21435 [Ramlibacter sp. AN1015]|uniref:hypothetical protein n=1 Tax=Ramlibacter sp. AN1015 TaxID=3133428 RepID=UPI0030C4F579